MQVLLFRAVHILHFTLTFVSRHASSSETACDRMMLMSMLTSVLESCNGRVPEVSCTGGEKRKRGECYWFLLCSSTGCSDIYSCALRICVLYTVSYKASLLTCFLTRHASLPQKKTTIACARGSQSGACSSASSATPDRSWGAASSSWMLWYDCDCWFQLWNLNRTSPPFFFSSFSFFFFLVSVPMKPFSPKSLKQIFIFPCLLTKLSINRNHVHVCVRKSHGCHGDSLTLHTKITAGTWFQP